MAWNPREIEAARNLLYHYGQPGGWEPGSFTTALIRAMEAADSHNLDRLCQAFPEFTKAVVILQNEGSTALQQTIADLEVTP